MIDLAQRVVEISVGFDGHHRGKNLLTIDFHFRPGASQHGRLQDRACAGTSAEQAGPSTDSLLDPSDSTDGVAFPAERTDVGGFLDGIAGLQALDASNRKIV